MIGPGPASGRPPDSGDETEHWREAARLREEHAGWVVVWLARDRQYKAYKRMPGARRDTALAASTAADLSAQITDAEQAAGAPAPTEPRDD
jgi:hypothetical protein